MYVHLKNLFLIDVVTLLCKLELSYALEFTLVYIQAYE